MTQVNTEIWKSIPGYEGMYEVSDKGNVRSIERLVTTREGIKQKYSGFLLKPELTANGYHRVTLSKNNKTNRMSVHRIVLAAFVGQDDCCVDHINEDKVDNRLSNLRYCSMRQNAVWGKYKTKKNSSLYGVTRTRYNTYRARIIVNRRRLHLGQFSDELEAAIAYKIADTEIELGIHPTERYAL